MSRVAYVKTTDRRQGVKASIGALQSDSVKGKGVLIKPNFNTADVCPGSTHNGNVSSVRRAPHAARTLIPG